MTTYLVPSTVGFSLCEEDYRGLWFDYLEVYRIFLRGFLFPSSDLCDFLLPGAVSFPVSLCFLKVFKRGWYYLYGTDKVTFGSVFVHLPSLLSHKAVIEFKSVSLFIFCVGFPYQRLSRAGYLLALFLLLELNMLVSLAFEWWVVWLLFVRVSHWYDWALLCTMNGYSLRVE